VNLFKKPEPGEEWVDVTSVVRSTTSDSAIVPDSATPVYGFRLWTIERVMAKLFGTYGLWTVGRNEARCESGSPAVGSWGTITTTSSTANKPPHDAPARDCRCGFNALDKWEQLEIKAGHYGEPQVASYGTVVGGTSYSTTYPTWIEGNVEDILYPQVPGVAKGWGRVAIHSGGWRAQYAEIVALIDLCAVLPWFDRDESYHKLLEYSAKHYGVPVIERIPDLKEFE